MMNFHALLLLPSLLSRSLFAHAFAFPNGVIGQGKGKEAHFATVLTGGEGCDDDDLNDIRRGFADMAILFQASLPFEFESQPAAEFFGNPISVQNYTELIRGNLDRAARYAKDLKADGPINADIHIRCDDPLNICRYGNNREGQHAAYNVGNEPHVNFCKEYFSLDGLKRRVDKKAENSVKKYNLMDYYNRGTLWARMVMHFSDIGKAVVVRAVPGGPNSTREWIPVKSEGAMNTSVLAGVLNEHPDNSPNDIQTLKFAYGATRAKLLAVLSTQMAYDATNNAENYALYAQARYIMREKGFYPNVPIMDFPNEATILTNENLQDGEREKFAFFDMSDVVARPDGMEVKGRPLPSSASSLYKTSTIWLSVVILASIYNAGLFAFG